MERINNKENERQLGEGGSRRFPSRFPNLNPRVDPAGFRHLIHNTKWCKDPFKS